MMGQTDRQTDGRTDEWTLDSFINPAPHTMLSVTIMYGELLAPNDLKVCLRSCKVWMCSFSVIQMFVVNSHQHYNHKVAVLKIVKLKF